MKVKITPSDLSEVDKALEINSLLELAERYKNRSDSPLTFCMYQLTRERCPHCGELID